MRPRSLAGLVLLLALGAGSLPPAHAQDADRVALDQWFETFQAGHKLGWGHVRVVEHPAGTEGPRFTIERTSTHLLPSSEATVSTTVETDASGRVLRVEGRQTDPYGGGTFHADRPAEGGLSWSLRWRELEPDEGETSEDVFAPSILSLLAARADEPPADRTVPLLDLPGDGVEVRTIRCSRTEEGRLRLVHDPSAPTAREVILDEEGRLVRRTGPGLATETVPAPEAEARDPDRTRPAPDLEGLEDGTWVVDRLGLSIDGPSRGWRVRAREDERGYQVGLVHPVQATIFASTMPFGPPEGAEDRVRLGGLFTRQDRVDRPLRLESPEAVEFRGRPAIRFTASGRVGSTEGTGRGWFVPCPEGGLLIITFVPSDLGEALRPAVDAALERFRIHEGGPSREPRRVPVGGLSVVVPAHWSETARGFRSPDGQVTFQHRTGPVPDGMAREEFERRIVESGRRRLADGEVTSDGTATIDGREVRRIVIRGTVDLDGQSVAMRFVYLIGGDEDTLELTLGATSEFRDPDVADAILESIRWEE